LVFQVACIKLQIVVALGMKYILSLELSQRRTDSLPKTSGHHPTADRDYIRFHTIERWLLVQLLLRRGAVQTNLTEVMPNVTTKQLQQWLPRTPWWRHTWGSMWKHSSYIRCGIILQRRYTIKIFIGNLLRVFHSAQFAKNDSQTRMWPSSNVHSYTASARYVSPSHSLSIYGSKALCWAFASFQFLNLIHNR
jgi:hypothetical protein